MDIVTHHWIVMSGVVVSILISFVLMQSDIIDDAHKNGKNVDEIKKLKYNILKVDETESL